VRNADLHASDWPVDVPTPRVIPPGPVSEPTDIEVSVPLAVRESSGFDDLEDHPYSDRLRASSRRLRWAKRAKPMMSAAFMVGALASAALVWKNVLSPQVFTPLTTSPVPRFAREDRASVATGGRGSASALRSALESTGTAVELPPYSSLIGQAQQLLSAGNVESAIDLLQNASSLGASVAPIARVYLEQFKTIAKEAVGPCKPVAFSRPRIRTERRAQSPSVRASAKGLLVTWIDDHEQKERGHVYGVLLDASGRAIGPVRDLTPEATSADFAQLIAAEHVTEAERTVLLYSDRAGKEAGVRARFLDAEGRIDLARGQSCLVGAARAGEFWPSITSAPAGYFVAWQDDRDREKKYDLFVRALSTELEPRGPETRLTDYAPAAAVKNAQAAKVRYPAVAVAADGLVVAYRLDSDKSRQAQQVRIALDDIEKGGLSESREPKRPSREFRPSSVVNVDRANVDSLSIACGIEGCFVAWDIESGGAYAAAIDPNSGTVRWWKKFSAKGKRPVLATQHGQVAVAYEEASRLKLAFVARDGVSAASVLFRLSDPSSAEYVRPVLAPGSDPSEWVLAWQDAESPKGASEVFAARMICK